MKGSTRNAGIAGIVAGLGYLVQAIIGLIKPQTEVFSGSSDYILEAVVTLESLSILPSLVYSVRVFPLPILYSKGDSYGNKSYLARTCHTWTRNRRV
jgi:hypothetical protein